LVFQGTGVVVLPDNVAQTPKHAEDTHQMKEYNIYCVISWCQKGVCCLASFDGFLALLIKLQFVFSS
jgi:hypothetical protein